MINAALIIYFIVIIGMTIFVKTPKDKSDYLAGGHNVGTVSTALSVAATWIWAPALFVSAEKAYMNGYAGLLWFLVPNIICLLLFIPFAIRLRNKMPYGFTISQLMNETYGRKVKNIYVTQLSLLSLLSTIVQLVAGGKIISIMTGIPFYLTTIILGGVALFYSLNKGIRASIFTDAIQMVLILLACFILVPMAININGIQPITEGFKGIGHDTTLFNHNGIELMLAFGIPTTIGLIAGPFGDQNFYQRIFSVKRDKIKQSMILGAIAFAIVPIGMGILGFTAAGIGYEGVDTSVINFELIRAILPQWAGVVFLFVLLSGLLSTIDSNLNSISSLVNDVVKDARVSHLKWAMVILTVASITLSNIDMTIVDFFLIYGILRATTFGTTVMTLLGYEFKANGVFYGVLVALVVGVPTFVYAKINDILWLNISASIFTLVISVIIAMLHKKLSGGNRIENRTV